MTERPGKITKPLMRYLAVVMWLLVAGNAAAGSIISGADEGVAIDGYDPVAYFTDAKPQPGKPEFTADWGGTVWRFTSAEHRDLFRQMPEKYAPQYGGHCAYAVSLGRQARGDAEYWRVVDGKLYLNNNWAVHKLWQRDIPGKLTESEKNWPQLKDKIEHGK